MKIVLKIFIPLCVLSFIAFGISVAVLGTNRIPEGAVSEVIFSDTASTYVINDSFTSIKADIGAHKLTIQPWSESAAQVTVNGTYTDGISAGVSGDTLNIRTEWSWGGDWFSRLISGNAFDTEVLVMVPEKTYKKLELHTGAGSLKSDRVAAEMVYLDVGAGKLEYEQPEGYKAQYINTDVSAGTLSANNALTAEYRIDVSAGSADISGLTGGGNINVSAGSAYVKFADLDYLCYVDVSAGEAIIDIPEKASAKFICDKSAGDIHILAGGENRHAGDGDVISINGGSIDVDLSVSAGSIKVVSSTVSVAEESVETATDGASVTTAVSVTTSDGALTRVGEAFEDVFSTAGDGISRAFSSLG